MEIEKEEGVFLTLNDCTVLFPGLKKNESSLSKDERIIMLKMEKVLYRNLSIREMEELLERGCPDKQQAPGIRGEFND